METILVTGAAGFIGSAFVELALQQGKKIVAIDKLTYAGSKARLNRFTKNSKFLFSLVDITKKSQLKAIFSEHRPDAVLNLAAETHVDRSIENPGIFFETNFGGMLNLLEVATEYCDVCKISDAFRLINVSTDEVYGSLQKDGVFTELSAIAPSSPYSASKAAADAAASAWHKTYGTPVITTRCSNNYGPNQNVEKFIPKIIHNALSNKPIPIYGNGENVRDWIYVYDHASALLELLEHGKLGETYNIGAGVEMKNIELANLICEILQEIFPSKIKYSSLIEYVPDRPGHDFRYSLSTNKICTKLSWKPQYTVLNAMRATTQHYIAHYR